MYNLSDKDRNVLSGVQEAIDKIFFYSKNLATPTELYEDEKSFDAILMNFVVIGEMVEKLSSEFKESRKTTSSGGK